MKLSGNTVLITGGASGIGLALAKELLKKENEVVVCGRTLSKLEDAASQTPGLKFIQCDITDESELQAMCERIHSEFPKLNVLVNNAGLYTEFEFDESETTRNIIDREIATNLIAPLKLTSLLLPQLKLQPQPAIVNISSGYAYAPNRTAIVYSATKAAIRSFTKSLRYQLAHSNIEVYEILPPLVDTPATLQNSNKKMSAESLAKSALAAIGKGKQDIPVGISKMLSFMTRYAPGVIDRQLAKL